MIQQALPISMRDVRDDSTSARAARSNVRVALTLASIAAIFFVGVFAARWFGPDGSGLSVLGLAIVTFLVVAIVRNVRSRQ